MKKTDSKIKKPIRVIFVVIVVVAIVLMYCIGPMAYVFAQTRNGIDMWASGAAIYIDGSNSFGWDYEGEAQYDPDSLTMLLTCLIAAENLDTEESVTVSGAAIDAENDPGWLKEGEVITVSDLIHLALMRSDTTAARMLAIQTAESEEDFVQLMNERALEIGCTRSEFHNACGHMNPGNLTSAKDVCLIAEAALDNDVVGDILSKKSYDLAATNMNEAATLSTSNLLMTGGSFKNYEGKSIKVEEDPLTFAGMEAVNSDKRTAAFSASQINGVDVIAVTLNDYEGYDFADLSKLMAYSTNMIQPYKAVEKGTAIEKKAKVKNGAVGKVAGEVAEDGYVNLLEGASASLILVEPEFYEVTAPVSKGDVIGKDVIYLADVPVSSVDIVAVDDVAEGWIFSRIGIPNSVALIIMIVLGVILLAFIALSITIKKNKAKARARREARIKEIAMKQLEQEKSARERDWPYR